jgi:hypothetical protein
LTRIDSVVEILREYHAENVSRYHTMQMHEGVDCSNAVTRCVDLMLPPRNGPVHSRCGFHPLLKAAALILIAIWEPRERKSRAASNVGGM